MLKLKDWAIRENIEPHMVYSWFHEGTLPVKATRVGPRLIIVEEQSTCEESSEEEVVIYARVEQVTF